MWSLMPAKRENANMTDKKQPTLDALFDALRKQQLPMAPELTAEEIAALRRRAKGDSGQFQSFRKVLAALRGRKHLE